MPISGERKEEERRQLERVVEAPTTPRSPESGERGAASDCLSASEVAPDATAVPDAAAAFAAMREAFERAALAAGGIAHEARLRLGGRAAVLRIVGPSLAERTRDAFAHVADDTPEAPALTIELWDGAATGIPAPAPPARCDARWDLGEREETLHGDGRFHRSGRGTATAWLDRAEGRIAGCVDPGSMTLIDRGYPLRELIETWHRDRGLASAHAALVAIGDGGALCVGKGGSGKSTSTLSCIAAGLAVFGDDYVAIERCADGSFRGHAVYASLRADARALGLFPELASGALAPTLPGDEGKHLLFPACPRVPSVRIAAVLAPEVRGEGPTAVAPLSRAEALRLLAPTSILGFPFRGGLEAFRLLGDLVASVPCYRLEIGRDARAIAARIREVLEAGAHGG